MIRQYVPQDAGALALIYYRGVHEGAAGAYSAAQRAAWAPEVPSAEAWHARLSALTTFVADDAGPVGFMSMDGDYLDFSYVLPERRGDGTAAALYDACLAWAQDQRFARLTFASAMPIDNSIKVNRFRGIHAIR
ncbi:MAG: GNAT family N-acetyltransferase [Paracoccaceae bacterium]|nr:GNAT family N-acetyltransferase [Paracoccaceae bacterium]